jgi:predicted site-specific integrase-resolvase
MKKISYRPAEAAEQLGIGLSTLWTFVKQGRIKTKKLSSRVTVITHDELESFINTVEGVA